VTIGDPRARWGSCSAAGRIRYSWRLVLAPEKVLDYVVAHEVAHLAEMNHSPRFWRLVGTLHDSWQHDRSWLERHGPQLLLYG
jgi:predicted metal-dependent hydrolase